MKKLLFVLLLLIVLVIAGLVYADSRVRALAEERAEQRIATVVPNARDIDVTIDGVPFVLGVLLSGEVEAMHVDVGAVQHRGVEAHDVELTVEEIALDRDALIDEQRLVVTGIGAASVHASMTDDQVSKAMKRTIRFGPDRVWVTIKGHEVPVEASVRDRQVELHAPIPGVPPLAIALPHESVLPCTPTLEFTEGEMGLACSMKALPPQIQEAIARR